MVSLHTTLLSKLTYPYFFALATFSTGVVDQTRGISEALQEKYLPGVNYSDFDSVVPGMIDVSSQVAIWRCIKIK